MTTQTDEQEMAFVKTLRQHENRWVAIVESEGNEVVVAWGDDAAEAQSEAEAKGFPDAVLFKVPGFSVRLVP